jgi:hypothetical protein
MRERDHLADLGIGGRIILTELSRRRMRGRRLYLFASCCVEAEESCDHGNEP